MRRAALLVMIAAPGCRVAFDIPDGVLSCADYEMWPGLATRHHEFVEPATWLDAERACEAAGGHLVVIDSQAENDLVTTSVTTPWIAATDRVTEVTFVVVTGGAPAFASWPTSPPVDSEDDCVRVLASGAWDDSECDDSRAYVCECDGITAMPTTY